VLDEHLPREKKSWIARTNDELGFLGVHEAPTVSARVVLEPATSVEDTADEE
jgi:hypothetical protein